MTVVAVRGKRSNRGHHGRQVHRVALPFVWHVGVCPGRVEHVAGGQIEGISGVGALRIERGAVIRGKRWHGGNTGVSRVLSGLSVSGLSHFVFLGGLFFRLGLEDLEAKVLDLVLGSVDDTANLCPLVSSFAHVLFNVVADQGASLDRVSVEVVTLMVVPALSALLGVARAVFLGDLAPLDSDSSVDINTLSLGLHLNLRSAEPFGLDNVAKFLSLLGAPSAALTVGGGFRRHGADWTGLVDVDG